MLHNVRLRAYLLETRNTQATGKIGLFRGYFQQGMAGCPDMSGQGQLQIRFQQRLEAVLVGGKQPNALSEFFNRHGILIMLPEKFRFA